MKSNYGKIKEINESRSNPNKSTHSVNLPSQYDRDKALVHNYEVSKPYMAYDNYTSDVALAELRIRIHETEHKLKYYWMHVVFNTSITIASIVACIAVLMNVALKHFTVSAILIGLLIADIIVNRINSDLTEYSRLKHDLEHYNKQYKYWDRSTKFRL